MTFEDGLRIAQLVGTVASGALTIYLYVRSADRAKVDALALQLQEAIARDAAFNTRVSVLEVQMKHVPTHGDLVAIREEMREMNGVVSAIAERSESTQEMVTTIQRYLLEDGRK